MPVASINIDHDEDEETSTLTFSGPTETVREALQHVVRVFTEMDVLPPEPEAPPEAAQAAQAAPPVVIDPLDFVDDDGNRVLALPGNCTDYHEIATGDTVTDWYSAIIENGKYIDVWEADDSRPNASVTRTPAASARLLALTWLARRTLSDVPTNDIPRYSGTAPLFSQGVWDTVRRELRAAGVREEVLCLREVS